MFCSKCGNECKDNASVCPECGMVFSEEKISGGKIKITYQRSCLILYILTLGGFLASRLRITFNGLDYKLRENKSISIDVVGGQYGIFMYIQMRVLFFKLKVCKKTLQLAVKNGEEYDINYKMPFFTFQQGKTKVVKRNMTTEPKVSY